MIIHWIYNSDGITSCSRADLERNPEAEPRYWWHLKGSPIEVGISSEQPFEEAERLARVNCPKCRAYLKRNPTPFTLANLAERQREKI